MPKLTQDQLLELSRAANYEWETLTQYYDTSDWIKILKELGFVEAGGRWVKMITSYASTVKQSVTTAGAAAGTTATIYETVTSPVSKIIASNTGTKVTTSGILTATSTSIGAVACAAALGFKIGVDWFEAMPEFWTKLSNDVFQTNLKPNEIGQITRDTNALIMIKDGVSYMAEDLITAIRNSFFDNGAATIAVEFPEYSGETVQIPITREGSAKEILPYILEIVGATELDEASQSFAENWNTLLNFDGYIRWTISHVESSTQGRDTTVYFGHIQNIPFTANSDQIAQSNGKAYSTKDRYAIRNFGGARFWNNNGKLHINYISLGTNTPSYEYLRIGQYVTFSGDIIGSSVNTSTGSLIKGVTPTGKQGTKDQTIDEVFPEWVEKAVTTIGDAPDTARRWFPVALPSTDVEAEGNPLTTTEAQTGIMPEPDTEAATQLQTNTDPDTTTQAGEALQPTPLPTPKPTITPTPEDPAIAGGGGSATGLANLYNPTLAQVKQFSRWLWGSDGLNLDQLKKLLQDPMQAIIGLHVMYATPTTGANRDIQVGYINSGVQSKIVTEQYTEIDCGTVTINEYFGDARDYSPYTQVYCYLPFIGIVELNADDVVNSTLGIKYKIDVLTGCCLAQLTVKKYGLNAVLYTYTGNCAVQMPITSGNYLSTVSSLLGAVVSGAAAVATGGALAPVAIGAAANAMGGGARASVAMSGSLGSNAGAMGIRKPYLIIKRVESADANGYNEFYGYPTNKRVNLSQLTGYVRVKEINLSGTNATEDEQNEIITLLKEGVIL